jgi:integrase
VIAAGHRTAATMSKIDYWHRIRRTYATACYIRHGLATTRERLGHSADSVTLRYIDQRLANPPDEAEFLDDIPAARPHVFKLHQA